MLDCREHYRYKAGKMGKAATIQKRISGERWQKIRSTFLRSNPLCVACQDAGRITAATELDHKLALINGGADEPGNYQALCHECHAAKTRIDLGQKARPAIGIDGWPIG